MVCGELNFGGGGGGGIVCGGSIPFDDFGGGMTCESGGGGGIPFDDDCTNFFGGAIVDMFLKLSADTCSSFLNSSGP